MYSAESPVLSLTRGLSPVLRCWHCDLLIEPTGVLFQQGSCSAGTLVRFSLRDSGQHLSCRRQPGRDLTSWFEVPAVYSRSVSASTGGSFPLDRWFPIESPLVVACLALSFPEREQRGSLYTT